MTKRINISVLIHNHGYLAKSLQIKKALKKRRKNNLELSRGHVTPSAYHFGFLCWSGGVHVVACFPGVCELSHVCHVYRSDTLAHTHTHTYINTHTHTQIDRELCSNHCKAKACNMIRTFFFFFFTWTQMHYMCQQIGSPFSSMGKTLQYTHQCIMVLFFYIALNYTFFFYMVIFIHDSFKLNVTTVERQARMKWAWMVMDAMRCGCYVESCRRDVM